MTRECRRFDAEAMESIRLIDEKGRSPAAAMELIKVQTAFLADSISKEIDGVDEERKNILLRFRAFFQLVNRNKNEFLAATFLGDSFSEPEKFFDSKEADAVFTEVDFAFQKEEHIRKTKEAEENFNSLKEELKELKKEGCNSLYSYTSGACWNFSMLEDVVLKWYQKETAVAVVNRDRLAVECR